MCRLLAEEIKRVTGTMPNVDDTPFVETNDNDFDPDEEFFPSQRFHSVDSSLMQGHVSTMKDTKLVTL